MSDAFADVKVVNTLARIEEILSRQLVLMEENNHRMSRVADLVRQLVKRKQLEREIGQAIVTALLNEDL